MQIPIAELNAAKNLEEAHASVGACRVFVFVCMESPYFRWLRRYERDLEQRSSLEEPKPRQWKIKMEMNLLNPTIIDLDSESKMQNSAPHC